MKSSICSRREFVKGLGLSAAAVAALPAWAADTTWRMRLATSTIQFHQLPLEQACAQIAKLGFEAVDIWDKFSCNCTHLSEAEKLGGDGLKALLAHHRLKLSAFTVYKTSFEQYAALLGAAGGGVAVRGSVAGNLKPAGLTGQMKNFLEQLKPQVELAEANNSYLAIENHMTDLLSTPDSFKAFVDLNSSPRVGIAFAPYHLQAMKASVTDLIRVCGRQLFFFYAWQKAAALDQLPGHGPTDFKPWLRALAEIEYTGCINPFMHGEVPADKMAAALGESRDYLKRLAT